MITPKEIMEWQLYEQLEPFGEKANWTRHAVSNANLVNRTREILQTKTKRKLGTVKPEVFLPRDPRHLIPHDHQPITRRAKPKMTPNEIQEKIFAGWPHLRAQWEEHKKKKGIS